ncbi:glutamate 5-kinase [Paracoccus sp. 1_MG-2023]|uniref:glutamate 5-kinase n=1 Tax=Paracoccus sp. 1_MG-2023 TaxID=3062651 RepID=UPI001C09216D|nr:glutamate 5-kinase [Paracoccus sp. 1_MG-2023]MBU2958809.1 glutamate 5-kinase [Paracoccus sp. C2R09]MDO6667802.1 glutamate 5-kinase [Paracoccus sp. 1_MG-2023]
MAAVTPALRDARRLVVKIGSALLVGDDGLRADWLRGLCDDVAEWRRRGTDVVLVSSGSIALGRRVLDLPQGALPLEQAQAAAAVGQIRLARAYEEALAPHGVKTAQVLLTLEDSADRRRYLNSRATMQTLLSLGAVPIVNENDTVATDEIRFGDNDRLAAQIAVTCGADQLLLLSDVDGLYTANPKTDPDARHLPVIEAITPEIEAMGGDPVSGLSKGGMKTKLMAARTAVAGGCAMAIAEGSVMRPLSAVANGARASWFLPESDPQAARKRWIGAMKPRGALHVDQGAVAALGRGKSLLPAGVTRIEGDFGRGEPVAITGPAGQTIGLGLTRYTATEAAMIAGHQSAEIEAILGYAGRAALIHRDDMAL